MKNTFLAITSLLLAILFIYIFLFSYTFINFKSEFDLSFKSIEKLNFHKKYSKNLHHVREGNISDLLFKEPKIEDLLFTTINDPKDKEITVLFQGDSWMEQLTFPVDRNFASVETVKKFKTDKKISFINAGTASYAPSVMSVQLDILEKEFAVFPNIVIAYIDQSDIGDENCRYKHNKVFSDGILKSVRPDIYLMYRDLFNYSEIYGLSEIYLKDTSKISKTFHLINFKFKYNINKSLLRFYRKYISNSEFDKGKLKKCYNVFSYIENPKKKEVEYFEKTLKEYIKKIKQKKHIKKIFFVSSPHKGHLSKKPIYKLNVSDVIDNILKDSKDITHINLSKFLFNDKYIDNEEIWIKDDSHHFNSNFHANFFMKKILDELSKYLINT